MPLNITLTRDGKETSPTGKGWNGHDLNAAYTVCLGEALPDLKWNEEWTMGEILEEGRCADFFTMGLPYLMGPKEYPAPLIKTGKQTVKRDHVLDPDDKDPMVFKKDDVIKAWRD